MIDEKYKDRVKVMLENKLKRPAHPNEIINALTDANLAAELLLDLHEENAAKVEKLQTDVEKVKSDIGKPDIIK